MTKLKIFNSEVQHHQLLLRNKGKALKEKDEAKSAYLENTKILEELAEQIRNYDEQIRRMEKEIREYEAKKGRRGNIFLYLQLCQMSSMRNLESSRNICEKPSRKALNRTTERLSSFKKKGKT